jgi:hypothetical protein
MRTACGERVAASPPWIAVVRKLITAGEIDLADAAAEVLWRRRQAAGR